MDNLTFQKFPVVTLATNTFINVPIILRYEDLNLIEIIKEMGLDYEIQIPIFHQDGTYLAKVKGNRVFPTEEGKKAGITLEKRVGITACQMNKQTLFEIHYQTGDSFKAYAELFTNDGYFVKCTDNPRPDLIDTGGNALKIGGVTMSNNRIQGCRIGIWLKKDGSLAMGANLK